LIFLESGAVSWDICLPACSALTVLCKSASVRHQKQDTSLDGTISLLHSLSINKNTEKHLKLRFLFQTQTSGCIRKIINVKCTLLGLAGLFASAVFFSFYI